MSPKFWIILSIFSLVIGAVIWGIFSPKPIIDANPHRSAISQAIRESVAPSKSGAPKKKPSLESFADSISSNDPAQPEKWRSELTKLNDLFYAGDHENLRALMERLLKENPESKSLRAIDAGYFYFSGDFEQAEKSFQEYLRLDPKNAAALTSLAEVQAAQEKLSDALSTQRQAIEADPKNFRALNLFTELSEESQEGDRAVDEIRQLVERDISNVAAVSILSRQLSQRGEGEERRMLLDRAYKANPDNPYIEEQLALQKLEEGDSLAAIDFFERAAGHHQSDQARLNALQMALHAAQNQPADVQAKLQREFDQVLERMLPNGGQIQ